MVKAKAKKQSKKKIELEVKKEIESIREEEELDSAPVGWKEEEILAPVQEESADKEKKKVQATFGWGRVITESSDEARIFYAKSSFGTIVDAGKVQLSLLEALYLLEKGKLDVIDKKKRMSSEEFIKKARKVEPNFWIRYCVFKDMRSRGYIIKTALKFGADFRVYDRGIKPGQDHARWIIFPVHEGETLTWYEFAAKNRVAHSTKKRLMMGVVDDEGDVTYYEIKWMRP